MSPTVGLWRSSYICRLVHRLQVWEVLSCLGNGGRWSYGQCVLNSWLFQLSAWLGKQRDALLDTENTRTFEESGQQCMLVLVPIKNHWHQTGREQKGSQTFSVQFVTGLKGKKKRLVQTWRSVHVVYVSNCSFPQSVMYQLVNLSPWDSCVRLRCSSRLAQPRRPQTNQPAVVTGVIAASAARPVTVARQKPRERGAARAQPRTAVHAQPTQGIAGGRRHHDRRRLLDRQDQVALLCDGEDSYCVSTHQC